MTAIKRYMNFGIVQKYVCFTLAAILLLSTLMTGSYAWQTLTNKENLFSGAMSNDYSAVLQKQEKDADGKCAQLRVQHLTGGNPVR